MVILRSRPPPLPPLLLLKCALEPPTTGGGIRTRASLAHSVPEIGSSTRYDTPGLSVDGIVGDIAFVSKDSRVSVASLFNNEAQIASVKSPRAPTPPIDDSHGVVPAAGTSTSSVIPLSQVNISTTRTRAPSAVSLCHDLRPSMGTRASSAVPLSCINSAMGVQALNAAPVNNGTGACALRAPPRHASRSNIAAVTARRLVRLNCLYPPLPDRAVAVGFEV